MALLVLALRGAAAVLVLTALVGGVPRVVRAGLAAALGLWSAWGVAAAMLGGGAAVTALGGGGVGSAAVTALGGGGVGSAAVTALSGAGGAAVAVLGGDALWLAAIREIVIGATLGVLAALPLLAAAAAGRLVDLAGGGARQRGPYAALFGVLAAAVFVGIDGHVAVATALVDSFRTVPALGDVQPRALAALAGLIPSAVRLAIPWLVTAAVVELAVGIGMRVAGRAASHGPAAAATPAALVMMTATLVGTFAVALAALVRAAI